MKTSNFYRITFSLLLLVLFCSCTKQQTISSVEVNEREGRITVLSSHIKIESKILDAEYDLFNSSGFGRNSDTGLGPTDTDYKFAIKVKPSDIIKWKKGLVETIGDIKNERWIQEITLPRKQNWLTSTTPVFYTRPNEINATIVIYEKEGLIFKHIIQN